jgi:arginyl-tRNA synthetase
MIWIEDKIKKTILDIIDNKQIQDCKIEIPPDIKLGDYSIPCFQFAKTLSKSPIDIAQDLAKAIKLGELLEKVDIKGPYLNLYLNTDYIAKEIILDILFKKESYGKEENKNKTILIETPSPNTNKPLHLGHLRNMLLGISISNFYKFKGYDVKLIEVINDRGVHICKSMIAYQMFGNGKTPESENIKSDHFVGNFYVMFDKESKKDPSLNDKAQEMLKKWEENDPETRKLWSLMNKWVIDGFRETYKNIGLELDSSDLESEIYMKGKEVIKQGLDLGVFEKKADGSVIIDLEDENLGTKVLLRKDGTAVYITQDLYLPQKRYEEYKFDEMIYVVCDEQKYHFKVLFTILEKLGFEYTKNLKHFAYGFVELPDGKMKSREGNVVDIDDLLSELNKLATEEITKRYNDLDKKEITLRAKKISDSALKFNFLKYDPLRKVVYDSKKSLSFEGETGPYIQYTYARLNSILEKLDALNINTNPNIYNSGFTFKTLRCDLTKRLIKLLGQFPNLINNCIEKLNPSLLTRFLLDLSQLTNEFYHQYPIMTANDKEQKERIALILAIMITLKLSLEILGIKKLDKM